jgi:putative redox protein
MTDVKITWQGKLGFIGVGDRGYTLPLDGNSTAGGEEQGFAPFELLALGIAGCTGMDVISILQKKRQDVTHYEVRVHGDRAEEHPKVFTHIEVEYVVTGHNIDPEAVARAVQLSEDKYCGAEAMFRKVVPIEHRITIVEAEEEVI